MSKKGQIVIPKEIRENFGIQPRDALIFDIQEDKIVIEKIEEKMTDILENSKPVENSIEFQKKLRDEIYNSTLNLNRINLENKASLNLSKKMQPRYKMQVIVSRKLDKQLYYYYL